MSKPEDKTLNTLRVVSDKKASKNQGSIVTAGGIYAEKNVDCEELATDQLVVRGLTKLAGDVSIGGTLYFPDLYSIDNDMIRFKRNLLPARPIGPATNSDYGSNYSSLGTFKEPWDIIYAKSIKTNEMNLPAVYVGPNCYGTPSFQVQQGIININDNFNIINPATNLVMMKNCDDGIESFAPIYQLWDSFRAVQLSYNPEEILHLTSSNILLNIGDNRNLNLRYDGNPVPDSTKVKIYFVGKNQLCKVNYRLTLNRFKKQYVFTSTIPAKKIKLIFLADSVYLI